MPLRCSWAVHPWHCLGAGETLPMRKPTTGEPYAGEPHLRFGGRGGVQPLSDPYRGAVCASWRPHPDFFTSSQERGSGGARYAQPGGGFAVAAHVLAPQRHRPVSTSGLAAFADILQGAEVSFGSAASQPGKQQSASGSGNRDMQSRAAWRRYELAFLYYLY
jgi:hypothetical protein